MTNSSGSHVVIHTFPFYIQNAVTALQAKGAIPIVSSQTPDNIWTGNAISAGPRFVGYMVTVGTRTGAVYVDHYNYVAQAYDKLGQTLVTSWYPLDHTHTSPTAANVVAEAFVRGLLCGTSTLKAKVNAAGQAAPSETDSLVSFEGGYS
jgi:rhamnogalacturonan acetylesterase